MEINGKPVEDATEHLTIEISPEDCSQGRTKAPSSCAAARAIVRDYEVVSARVHVGVTYVEEEDRWIRYLTPGSLRTEIIAFDRGSAFEPGRYTLAPPPASNAIGAQRNRKPDPKRAKHKKRKHRPRHNVTNVRERAAYQ